jgi:hypothetical protein
MTASDFDALTRQGDLCNKDGALAFEGFEAVMREQVLRTKTLFEMTRIPFLSLRSTLTDLIAAFAVAAIHAIAPVEICWQVGGGTFLSAVWGAQGYDDGAAQDQARTGGSTP